jgi:hypothetical protein
LKKRRKDWREWIGTFERKGLICGYLEDKKNEREKDKSGR